MVKLVEAMVNERNGEALLLGDAREKAERCRRQLLARVPDLEAESGRTAVRQTYSDDFKIFQAFSSNLNLAQHILYIAYACCKQIQTPLIRRAQLLALLEWLQCFPDAFGCFLDVFRASLRIDKGAATCDILYVGLVKSSASQGNSIAVPCCSLQGARSTHGLMDIQYLQWRQRAGWMEL